MTLVDIDMVAAGEVSVQVKGMCTRRLAELVGLINDTYSSKVLVHVVVMM